MEEIYASGRVAGDRRLELPAPPPAQRSSARPRSRPAVNQIEVHPYLAQDELRAFDADHEIVTEAWSPIARGKVADDPVIAAIAERLGRTPGAGRRCAGTSSAATSSSRSRSPAAGSRRTSRIFDFELDESDDGGDHRAGPRRAHRPQPGRVQLHPRLSSPAEGPKWPFRPLRSVGRDEVDELLDPADEGRLEVGPAAHAGEDPLRPDVAGVVLPAQPPADARPSSPRPSGPSARPGCRRPTA